MQIQSFSPALRSSINRASDAETDLNTDSRALTQYGLRFGAVSLTRLVGETIDITGGIHMRLFRLPGMGIWLGFRIPSNMPLNLPVQGLIKKDIDEYAAYSIRVQDKFVINSNVSINVERITGDKVHLLIDTPRDLEVSRPPRPAK